MLDQWLNNGQKAVNRHPELIALSPERETDPFEYPVYTVGSEDHACAWRSAPVKDSKVISTTVNILLKMSLVKVVARFALLALRKSMLKITRLIQQKSKQ